MPAPALDYAPPPTARRRWMRRLRRGWPIAMLLIVAGLGIAYGPGIWRCWQVIRLQEACMTAELPTDRPVAEEDPIAAKVLVAAWPGEYRLDRWGFALRTDPRWAAFAATIGATAASGVPSAFLFGTLFCHERHTPDGRRRLVVVEGWYYTVIEPARLPVGDGPRVVRRGEVEWNAALTNAFATANMLTGPIQTGAGVPDAVDPSRFTAPFVWNGIAGKWEYQLGNDDCVTVRLLDPAGFIARANAAKAKAATQPAP